ncbi:hypothetical protein ACOBV8_20875 (plasmid) [Pseudoalteromonas espejiana]
MSSIAQAGLRLANKQEFEILGHIAIAAKSSTNIEEVINWVKITYTYIAQR